ncbi:MAG TPA: 1-deoxy-D-xylulose-5-phosphate synthase [Thiotrichaceae bacterium]|nr:1-deoxy-D-xylulose-5-phosphate synthase [Thiotrichaceae bacterium]
MIKTKYPNNIHDLAPSELEALCTKLREDLLVSVANSGGHLASNLGTVELTVALHHILNLPTDKIVWDVGHQAYIHKMLTGRNEQLGSIRTQGGLSGFPKRSESQYDSFGTGHSSTSISAALGMALAARNQGKKQESVAVIGDGAMTAGMAYEALNHAGDMSANILVILNDNDMSISPNVGALSKYLTRLISSKTYSRLRESGKKILSSSPSVKRFTQKSEEHVKGMVMPGTLFEEMGFTYYGPVDGHDINELVIILKNLTKQTGPRLLHVRTKKGKGYKLAENDPCAYHGVSHFELQNGMAKKTPGRSIQQPTYTQVFSQWLCDMAKSDDALVGITPAMRDGSGLVEFSKQYPDRYYDVAIAEQHAVTLAAGFACEGSKPIVAIYSTFLQRAYDQLLHDVAIQDLDVTFAVDRAGLVGADGATHSGNYDLSFLRCIPNLVIMAPSNENECRLMLTTGYQYKGPAVIRYPRGKGNNTPVSLALDTIKIGKAKQLMAGEKIAILMFGSLRDSCEEAAKALNASLIDMRFIKPLDDNIILDLAATHNFLVTVEDNAIMGGAGSAVNELLHAKSNTIPVLNLGIADKYIAHASREQQIHACGLDGHGIISAIDTYHYGSTCRTSLRSLPSVSDLNH